MSAKVAAGVFCVALAVAGLLPAAIRFGGALIALARRQA